MSKKIPSTETRKWKIPNESDKFGDIYYTKNMNFDESGYAKLSPRQVVFADDTDDADIGRPLGFGFFGSGKWQVATGDQNFGLTMVKTSSGITEDTGSNNPDMTSESDGSWFDGRWTTTTATDVVSRPATGGASQAWVVEANGDLSSGYKHKLAEFDSRQTVCVTNNNTVLQYDVTSGSGNWSADTTLTLPGDYEAVGLAYNKSRMGIITRNSSDNSSQDKEAKFYIWDGTTTGATQGYFVGARECVAVAAYKSSFVILTGKGELLYFNGGGFTKLGKLPFDGFASWTAAASDFAGANIMSTDRERVFLNLGLILNSFNRKEEVILDSCHSGIWCYDPDVGLYHRYSMSQSKVYIHTITAVNINVATDTFTTATTIPPTGNIARVTSDSSELTDTGNGLTLNTDYYVIKLTASTFQLAETKEKALEGVAVNLSDSLSPAGPIYFYMFDLTDYGCTKYSGDESGAIGQINEENLLYKEVISGAQVYDVDGTQRESICYCDPFLENRGYIVTSKKQPRGITDKIQRVTVKFRPLGTDEKIIIKERTRDVRGVPVSNTSVTDIADWTSDDEFTTTTDVSEAMNHINSGGDIEVEIIGGAGGGQMVQVDSISTDGDDYSVVLKEVVIGAEAGRKSHFIMNNWKPIKTITSERNDAGYDFVETRLTDKWVQYKIELQGNEVTLEELIINSDVHMRT